MKIMEKMNNFIMKNILVVLAILVLLYVFMGSSNKNIEPAYGGGGIRNMAVAADSAPMARMYKTANVAATASDTKIIKTYSLSIETKNIEKAKSAVDQKVLETNSLVDNFYSYSYSGNESAYTYSLRVPTEKIDEVFGYFKTLGTIKNESVSANDATEQYRDNANRLKNLYARRDRLRKMMESRTEKLADIIAVDRELSSVQTEIENIENANKRIDTNVSYTRLDLSLLPELKLDFNNSQWRLDLSWKKAVNDMITFGQKSVDFGFKVIAFLPFIVVALLALFIIRKIYKKEKNK